MMSRKRKTNGGFSLIEVVLSVSLFAMAAGAASSAFLGSSALSRSNLETAVAVDAAQSAVDAMRSVEFGQVFALFNGTEADGQHPDWPAEGFDVPGLQARPEDPDGRVGRIEFPGDGVRVFENIADRDLGLPRDLDGDGGIDQDDHAGDYRVLPVRVWIEWTGHSGDRSMSFVTTLGQL